MSEPLRTRPEHVLEDPGAKAVASMYAQSYLSAADENDIEDPIGELHSFVTEVLHPNPELQQVITSGMVSRDRLLGMLERSVIPHCSEFFANFLKVLTRHGRLDLVEVISTVVGEIQETRSGKKQVFVRSARSLSGDARSRIYDHLQQTLGFEPILKESVDESLLGGMIIQIGDTVYDSSLRTRLKTLTGRLTERTFNEIQSGRDRFSHPEGD